MTQRDDSTRSERPSVVGSSVVRSTQPNGRQSMARPATRQKKATSKGVLYKVAPTVRRTPSAGFVKKLKDAGVDPEVIRVLQGKPRKRHAH